jgi:hypothetical protein
MKTVIFIVFLFVSLTNSKSTINSEWGEWKTTSCFRGLDFCVRKASYNEYAKKYEWWVKFRNRYHENVSFNCVLKESHVNTAKGTDRVTVKSGSEGGNTWFLVADGNAVNLFIGELRFGNDDWGTPHANCDSGGY